MNTNKSQYKKAPHPDRPLPEESKSTEIENRNLKIENISKQSKI